MDIENNQENSSREEISIGPLLRLEREKKGISIQRLSEIIKIREQVIEAIENEEWKRLPARVFIKGFIRSYTNAIGYDTIKALRLFDKTVPLRGEERPRPLTRNVKKVNSLYYIIALLLLIAAAVYIYRVHLEIDTLKAPRPAGELSAVTEEATEAQPEIIDNISFQDETDPFTDISTPYDAAGAQDSTQEIISGSNTGQMIEEIQTQTDTELPPQQDPAVVEPVTDQDTPRPAGSEALTEKELTATVTERTWVKIVADDTPPKEYIFQPGAKHTWRAERGFEVTVGNAGGIEFTFNSEQSSAPGVAGEVKKLRFPNDFQTKWEE